jgi:hypothetical protein
MTLNKKNMNIFLQLDKQDETRKKVFDMWDRGEVLRIPPELEVVAEMIGNDYYTSTGKVAKIRITNQLK